jgi:nitroreductase
VACPVEAISIAEPYHADEGGFWATDPQHVPAKMPLDPKDADGNPTEWNAIERAVLERRSVRNYKKDPVPDSLIRRVLEAGRFAPSAGNCQPWKFIVITDRDLLDEIDKTVHGVVNGISTTYRDDEAVKNLADMVNPEEPGMFDPRLALGGMGAIASAAMGCTLNAPALVLILGDTRSIGGPQINIGIAGQNMNLVANSLGIKACWVGFVGILNMVPGFPEKLGIQPPWRIFSSLTLGWPAFKQEGIVPREYRPVAWYRAGAEGPEIEE